MWIRALQIGIGVIAIGLSISSMIYPAYAVVATFVAAGVILFLLGIEEIVAGIFLYRRSRLSHVGLGALIIILASLVMAFPLPTATLLIWVTAFALLFGGIASILSGLRARNRVVKTGRASRALSVGAGALAVAFSVAIIVSPAFGVGLTGVLIGIALLFLGIRLVVRGILGRGYAMTSSSADSLAA
jgi:uncharacterized membrane protein HdeD (DUF308 family)